MRLTYAAALNGLDVEPLRLAMPAGLGVDAMQLRPPVLVAKDTAVPTMILSGEADPITPPVFARDATAILGPGSRLVGFSHVGHGVEEATPCGEAWWRPSCARARPA